MNTEEPEIRPEPDPARPVACSDRGEAIGLMEPMLIGQSSRHRGVLAELAAELSDREAGYRGGLPPGIREAVCDLIPVADAFHSNLSWLL